PPTPTASPSSRGSPIRTARPMRRARSAWCRPATSPRRGRPPTASSPRSRSSSSTRSASSSPTAGRCPRSASAASCGRRRPSPSWAERRRRPPIRARFFGLIVAESLVYAVVLAFVVGGAVGLLVGVWAAPVNALAQVARLPLTLQLALSIGAGLYEELVFRVLLVGGLFLLARRFFPARWQAYLAAALVGAFLFSLVHYVGAFGDPFTLPSFTFRFLFGLALNGVFLLRGFAVAAWTHALYDVLVVTGAFL